MSRPHHATRHTRSHEMVLALAVAALVVLAVPVAAYAADVTPPVLTTDNDGQWHSQAFNVTLSATDDLSGVDLNSFNWSTNGGSTWTNSSVYHQAAPVSHAADGIHLVLAHVSDLAGNPSTPDTKFYTHVDTRAPVTMLLGETPYWTTGAVTLTFLATDVGSGVSETDYSTDAGATWNPVPADGQVAFSSETPAAGLTVQYRSKDNCVDTPNVEVPKSTSVFIDMTDPTAAAKANVTVKKGAKATFKYAISDNLSPTCWVALSIYKKGKLVKVVRVGDRPSTNLATVQSKKIKITLSAGAYTWRVSASDQALNSATSGAKKLTVKP